MFENIRDEVEQRILSNADKMLNRHKQNRKQVVKYQVNDLVHVPKLLS